VKQGHLYKNSAVQHMCYLLAYTVCDVFALGSPFRLGWLGHQGSWRPLGPLSSLCGPQGPEALCCCMQNSERNPGVLLSKLVSFPTPYTFQVGPPGQIACGVALLLPA